MHHVTRPHRGPREHKLDPEPVGPDNGDINLTDVKIVAHGVAWNDYAHLSGCRHPQRRPCPGCADCRFCRGYLQLTGTFSKFWNDQTICRVVFQMMDVLEVTFVRNHDNVNGWQTYDYDWTVEVFKINTEGVLQCKLENYRYPGRYRMFNISTPDERTQRQLARAWREQFTRQPFLTEQYWNWLSGLLHEEFVFVPREDEDAPLALREVTNWDESNSASQRAEGPIQSSALNQYVTRLEI